MTLKKKYQIFEIRIICFYQLLVSVSWLRIFISSDLEQYHFSIYGLFLAIPFWGLCAFAAYKLWFFTKTGINLSLVASGLASVGIYYGDYWVHFIHFIPLPYLDVRTEIEHYALFHCLIWM